MPNLPRSPSQRAAAARRMTPGAAGGRSHLVAPPPRQFVTTPHLPPTIPYMPFSQADEDVTVAESGEYELQVGGPLGVWIVKLRVAGTTTTTTVVKQNGTTIGTVNLTSGLTRAELDLSDVLGEVGDNLRAAITVAGTGAKKWVLLAPIR